MCLAERGHPWKLTLMLRLEGGRNSPGEEQTGTRMLQAEGTARAKSLRLEGAWKVWVKSVP